MSRQRYSRCTKTTIGYSTHSLVHGALYGVADDANAQVRQIIAIHLQQPPGDILVFMTGQVLHLFCKPRMASHPLRSVYYSFHGWNGSCGGCQEDIEATCALVVERIEQLDDKVNDIYI
jgi:hypothetical protein